MIENISQDILYIGTDDTELELFESQYTVPEGMAYNSYLIRDEKIAIIDTSDSHTTEEWKRNVREALQGKAPDYLIVQHMEPDHSAATADMLKEYPQLKVVASAIALRMLPEFFEDIDLADRTVAVGEGDTLCLGKHTLQFITAPMVHWPEVIITYERTEKILFSADAFGKFGALRLTGGLFCTPETDWACEARRYYFNICGKYGAQVQKLLQKVTASTEPKTICPLHGPVLTETIPTQLSLYNTWSSYETESEGIFIAHASIHGNTAKAADTLADILRKKGCPKVVVADLCRSDMAENIEDAFRYGTVVLAASSYDGTVFPPMHDFIWHLQIKGWQNHRVGIIENGSWAPSAGRVMKEMLSKMKNTDIIEPMVTIRSVMKERDKVQLKELAARLMGN